MRSEEDFFTLLQRYATGHSPAVEQQLLDRWLAHMPAVGPPELTPEELNCVRAAIWQRIQAATWRP